MFMRHFLAGALAGPALGHPIGVTAAAVTGLLEPSPCLSDLPPRRLGGAFGGAVPEPPVADPAKHEVALAQGAPTEKQNPKVQATTCAAVDLKAGSCESSSGVARSFLVDPLDGSECHLRAVVFWAPLTPLLRRKPAPCHVGEAGRHPALPRAPHGQEPALMRGRLHP
jgi:hypothetical protein